MMCERICLEEKIEQVTKIIDNLSLTDNEIIPCGWKEQKKEPSSDGRKTLRRGVQWGLRRGKLEEVRRARTTSGTSKHHHPQEKKELRPKGGLTYSEGPSLRPESAEQNISIYASKSPVKDLIHITYL